MERVKELKLDIDEIRFKLGINDKRQATIPEMLLSKFKEPTISRWISYLLNPEYNKYALDILNILLKAVRVPECKSEDYSIYNECFLGVDDDRNKDNYIDIYISTSDYIIGIEVKLDAGETDNQTLRYHKVIVEQSKTEHKIPVEIYLKPDSNSCIPQCAEYKSTTFSAFLFGLKQLTNTLPQDRDHFLIDEFIMYLEQGPERARFISKLSIEEKAILDNYHKNQLYNYIKEYFKDNGFIVVDSRHKESEGFGFVQLVRVGKERWKKELNFHYELLWNDSHYLALHKKIVLAAHLEPPTNNKNRRQIIKNFAANLFDGRTLYSEEICIDFSSIEQAHKSLEKISRRLEENMFSRWGSKADYCIEKIFDNTK